MRHRGKTNLRFVPKMARAVREEFSRVDLGPEGPASQWGFAGVLRVNWPLALHIGPNCAEFGDMIISPHDIGAPPPDGRQSETALMVARGVRRLLRQQGFSSLPEVALMSGRRADILALAPDGTLHIIEIKSSVADFRADQKWRDYRAHCDRLYFAIPQIVPLAIMPADAGLIVADAYGAAIIHEAPEHRLPPATRRVVLLRFAQLAADRLHQLWDPGSGTPA